PNVGAVLWFVREVWPRVLAGGFSDRFVVAGSKTPPEIVALASDRIEVRGQVADLAPLFDACRLSVAPVRFGAGIKGKIVSSLSYGVPGVASSIAAEGMSLHYNDEVLVADTPDAMATEILRLYRDPVLWQKLSSNGYHAFEDHFSQDAVAGRIVGLFDNLIGR